jgi:hypothetical protein
MDSETVYNIYNTTGYTSLPLLIVTIVMIVVYFTTLSSNKYYMALFIIPAALTVVSMGLRWGSSYKLYNNFLGPVTGQ